MVEAGVAVKTVVGGGCVVGDVREGGVEVLGNSGSGDVIRVVEVEVGKAVEVRVGGE